MSKVKFQKRITGNRLNLFLVSFSVKFFFNRFITKIFIVVFFIISEFQPVDGKICVTRNEISFKLQDMENFDALQADDTSELIVQFRPDSEIFVDEIGNVISRKGADTGLINDLLKKHHATIKPIGSKLTTGKNKPSIEFPDFFVIRGKGNLEAIRQKLLKTEIVDSAYIKPPAEDPEFQE